MAVNKMKTCPIDGTKLKAELRRRRLSAIQTSKEMGYGETAIHNAIERRSMSSQMALLLDKLFGIKYDLIKPDDTKPEPAQTALSIPTEKADVDLDKLEELLEKSNQLLKDNSDFIEAIKQGFRVQTSPRIIAEDISQGVRDGLMSWWNQINKDFYKRLLGTMYSAMIQAINAEGKQNENLIR